MMDTKDRPRLFMELMTEALPTGTCADLKNDLAAMGFFHAPASTRFHGNYEGGLFDHSYGVTKSLLALTEKLGLVWENRRSPYLVGMLHDLCKCDQYIRNADGTYSYQQTLLPGHGDKSVILALRLMDLSEEEIACIRYHMGAYEGKEMWDNYGKAISMYPNVLYTHTADMIASKIAGV